MKVASTQKAGVAKNGSGLTAGVAILMMTAVLSCSSGTPLVLGSLTPDSSAPRTDDTAADAAIGTDGSATGPDAERPLPPGDGDGLSAIYWASPDLSHAMALTGPNVTRIEPVIALDWGRGSPDPMVPTDSSAD